MNEGKIVVLGAPESGKTSYVSLALNFLYSQPGFDLSTKDAISPIYLGEWPRIMRNEQRWPDKTQTSYTGEYLLSYRAGAGSLPRWLKAVLIRPILNRTFRLMDLPGEVFQMRQDAKSAMYQDAEEKVGSASHFLLAVDSQKLLDRGDDTRAAIRIAGELLQKRFAGITPNRSDSSVYLAVVFTKWDTISELKTFDEVMELFQRDYAYFMSYALKKAKCRYFAVSCLPIEAHRQFTRAGGAVATKDWSVQDMEGQMEPLMWLLSKLPNKFSWCRPLL